MAMNTAKNTRITAANTAKPQPYNYGYPKPPIETPPIGIIPVPNNPVPNNAFNNNSGNIEKILTQFANQFQPQAQAQATTTGAGAGAGLSHFAANNKWLLIGGAGLLAYFMFFGGGLGASEKTVTSVTRYGRKS